MRSHDRMALVKMVQQFGAPGVVRSPAGTVMLVRLAAQLADDDTSLRKPMMQLLDGWLRHKSEMVNFEAAKAICDMRDVTDSEMTQAVHTLQLFLTSPRAVTKFAAIRILHTIAGFKPSAVQPCNPDIESLISNTNRSIATFAITTLLKTGSEGSIDRLMKQISTFMADITDEFKITIVEAIRTLCLKFPSKQAGMLSFLSGILRDEGGYEFKRSVVESMFDLIKFVPGSKEEGTCVSWITFIYTKAVQPWPIYVSSLKTANLRSLPSGYYIFLGLKAQKLHILRNISGISTIAWSWRTHSFERLQ